MSAASPAARGYLPTLDGWRTVAILAVIGGHATEPLFAAGGTWASPLAFSLSRHLFGVQLFFGISGFLICSRLIAELQRGGRIDLVGFYLRRTFRILPPYLVYLAVVSALTSLGALAVTWKELVSCLGFVRNYLPSPDGDGWYTGHFWSLAVEEHFYLLWPAFLAFAGLRRARRWLIVAALAIAVWRFVDHRLGLVSRIGFYGRTDIRLDGLLWGCALALVLRTPAQREAWQRLLSPRRWAVAVAAFAGCVALHPPLEMMWEALLVPLLLGGTVLHPGTWVGTVLESRPMRFMGRISYSLYIWQQLFLVASYAPRPLPLGVLQEWPWNLPVAFLCALVSYEMIERPMIRIGRRLTAKPRAPARSEEAST